MGFRLLLGVAWLCAVLPTGLVAQDLSGNFVTECRDRYFWMSTNGKFAGGNFRFDVIDRSGVYPLNDSYVNPHAAAYSFNLPGDLIFRASFLACHVESVNDVSYDLQYRFVRLDSLGRETVYPFSLSCSTESPWNPREIVCEENYMEVSVRKNVPVIAQEGLEKGLGSGSLHMLAVPLVDSLNCTSCSFPNGSGSQLAFRCVVPQAQGAVMSVWQVVFHQTRMPPKTMTATDARTAGYLVNSTSSRVIFRSPYGMPMSEVLLVSGIPVEVVRATVFYKQRWMLLLVDTSAACAKNPSVFDGTYLSWVTLRLITPLVLHPTKFLDKRITMGVEGRGLDEVAAISKGYQLLVNSTAVEIRIPFGAVGGYRKSHVIDNKYNQVYEIDLFLEHQWADDLWEVTQHRSFKPARSPYLPETPYVVNSEYSPQPCTVGPDVELKNMTLNGVPLTLPEAQKRGVKIIEVQHRNGTKDFVLKVPFDNPLVSVEYIGALIRRYTLHINYTLNIVPQNEPYFHPAAIVCDVKDVNLPDVKSFCTNRSVVFEVTPGNMDSSWELCIGSLPLPYTIAEPKITIELPLFCIGYIYEVRISQGTSLRCLTVRVELNMRNVKTLQVEKQFVQRCPIPTRELLVCFPNRVVTVVAVTMEPIPAVDPSKTTLLDKTCKPKEFDSTRALFTFGVNTCGTRSQIVGNYLIYENEVLYTRALFPPNAPVITRDSEYRRKLTIRCRYPLNDTLTLAAERKAVPAPAPYSVQGLGSLHFRSYDPMSRAKSPRDVLNLKARLARDVSYSQFYSAFPVSQSLLEPVFLRVELLQPHSQTDHLNWTPALNGTWSLTDVSYSQFYSAFPVSQSLLEPVFLRVELLQPHSQTDRLILQDCWATLTPELDSSPQWNLVTDR
ncbi:UNVERIFIED_CONTAM: hypothetical protein FKN15_070898 [Acipenser sinensis]